MELEQDFKNFLSLFRKTKIKITDSTNNRLFD